MQPWDTKDRMAEQPGAFLAACLPGWDSRAFGDILAELYDIGLLQQYDIGKDGFYHGVMHGMVQDVVRLRLGQAARKEYENLHLDIVFHSEQPTSAPEPFDKDMFYETTGDWLDDVIPLVESWAMPPWEQQVGQLILDVASSELGDGFPEFNDNHDFAKAVGELSSEVGMLAPTVNEKLVDKIMEVAQFATGVDEAIDDWHKAVDKPRVYTALNSLLPEALELLLPVLKQSGVFGKRFIYHVQIMGEILTLQDLWSTRAHGEQLLKAVLVLGISESVQSEVSLDTARSLSMLGQAFLKDGCHETADVMLKACLDLGREENADLLFILHAMCIYGTNLAHLDGRGRDALSTLRAAAGGFATIRGARDLDIHCNMILAVCSHHMGFSKEALGIVTKTLRSIHESGDAARFRSQEMPLTCFRFRFLSALGHSMEVVESTKEMISSVRESDLPLAAKSSLLVNFASILLEARRFDEAEAVAKEAICGFSYLGYPETYDEVQVAYHVLRIALGHVHGER